MIMKERVKIYDKISYLRSHFRKLGKKMIKLTQNKYKRNNKNKIRNQCNRKQRKSMKPNNQMLAI